MATQIELISSIRIELGDKERSVWANDELARAIDKSVNLLSRFIPKRSIVETTVVRTVTSESLVIASSTGTLAYKPIKEGTLTITGKTLDTHYRVNYLTGVITEIGSGLPDTTYTASYELDPYMLDISSLLPDYIRIERVEYPVGQSPATYCTFDTFGNILVLRGSTNILSDNYHLRIVYLGKWTAPTSDAVGDYPSHLDDVVIIGSAGQSLIFKAEEYMHLAKTAVTNAVSALGSISAVSFPSSPDLTTYLDDANTALDAAAGKFGDAIATLADMTAPLGSAGASFATVSGKVGTGEGYLSTGSPLINTGTRGDNVGEVYGAYAGHEADLAQRMVEAGNGYIAQANAIEAKSGRQTTVGNSYVNEAIQRLTMAARVLDKYASEGTVSGNQVQYYAAQVNKATQLANSSQQYLDIAGRFLASGQAKINEFLTALGIKIEFYSQKASSEQRS